jgi:Sec7-like guanine-nucleotide exchange factor
MNLDERVQAERNRVSGQLSQLKEQNDVDKEHLDELSREYHAAILSGTEQDIDSTNERIKEVNSRISRRNDMIKAIGDKHNPVIQNLISEEMGKWIQEIESIEDQAKAMAKKLEPQHNALLKGLSEINSLYLKASSYRSAVSHWTRELSSSAQRDIGLSPGGMDAVGPTPKDMRKLLIESHQVFKR